MNDDQEVLTCYHEAGHAVMGRLLGGKITRVQLGAHERENSLAQFGDCIVHWESLTPNCPWQIHRQLLTILAGPVAEMIYIGEKLHPAVHEPWRIDWLQAMEICRPVVEDLARRTQLLEILVEDLHQKMQSDEFWSAIAAVADELSAHEFLEQEQFEDCLRFWLPSY